MSSSHADMSFLDRSFMKVVGGEVDTKSSDYLANYEQMMALNQQLDDIIAQTVDVGQRQRDVSHKRDKCLPRERIDRVLDPGTPFLEVGQLAGHSALGTEESVPSGNIIAGVGVIGGR